MTSVMVAPPIACPVMTATEIAAYFALSYSEVVFALGMAGLEPVAQAPRRWATDDVHALPHRLPGGRR